MTSSFIDIISRSTGDREERRLLFQRASVASKPGIEPMVLVTVILPILVFICASCSQLFPTDIKKILDDPREYDGKTVTISGDVTESVNLIFLRYYAVRDATGEIVVVAKKSVPAKGAKLKVTGRVNQAFAIGDRSVVVIVEEEQ